MKREATDKCLYGMDARFKVYGYTGRGSSFSLFILAPFSMKSLL